LFSGQVLFNQFKLRKMKAKLFLVLFICVIVNGLKAQIKKGDFNISLNVGYVTPYTFNSGFSNSGVPIGLGLGYAVSDKIVIGIEFGFFNLQTVAAKVDAVHSTSSYTGNDTVLLGAYNYHFDISAIYFLSSFQYHWKNKEKYSLYSGIGLGYLGGSVSMVYDLQDEPKSTITIDPISFGGLGYQITAIGCKVTPFKHFGYHIEAGYGVKGIICGGIDIKF
jgi:opacity protein-like surface antigen